MTKAEHSANRYEPRCNPFKNSSIQANKPTWLVLCVIIHAGVVGERDVMGQCAIPSSAVLWSWRTKL